MTVRSLRTLALAGALTLGAAPALAASATLADPDGNTVGTVDLTQTPNGAHVEAELSGLPEGVHGFHIHETGSCSPDFGAAGGHFAGAATAHGFKSEGGPHEGDMPNIHVPASGNLMVEVFVADLMLDGGDHPLLDDDGAAIMVHSGADDYSSQPSGAAGDRIACGAISQ